MPGSTPASPTPSTPEPAAADTTATGAPRAGGAGPLGPHTVSRIGFGAMQLERLHEDRARGVALLRRAVELGVDHVDTAHFYGAGLVNGLIREALRPEDGVLIVSKVGAEPNPGGDWPIRLAQRPEQLREAVEHNLGELGVEQVPVVNLRRAETAQGLQAHGDQIVDLDDQLATMTALRDEGKIGAIGLSAVRPDTLRRALPAGIVCVQNSYSLLARDDEEMLTLCAAEGIAWVPFFPLGGAFPGIPKVTDEPAVRIVARALDRTPSQIGLAWLLHHAPHVLLIPGTADPDHLAANIAAGTITLDPDALSTLNTIEPRPAELTFNT